MRPVLAQTRHRMQSGSLFVRLGVPPYLAPSHICMHKDDNPAKAGSLRRLTVDELAAFAIQEKLIDAIELYDDRAVITQGDHRFVLPPPQASTFLIGMLRGRSWYYSEEAAAPETSTVAHQALLPGISKHVDTPSIPSLDTTLRSLLAFTQEVGIIEGYDRDDESESVRIDIPECSTDLSYAEAVNYLFDCIQHEMRCLRQRPMPGRSPSSRTNEL